MTILYKLLNDEKIFESSVTDDNIEIKETKNGNRYVFSIVPHVQIELIDAFEVKKREYDENDSFFTNGYQSWTESLEFKYNQTFRNAKKFPFLLRKGLALHNFGDAAFYDYKEDVFHGWDVSYVRGKMPLFIGNNNFKNAYLIIEHHKKNGKLVLKSDVKNVFLNENQEFCVFDYIICNDLEEGKNEYFSKFKRTNAEKLFGYSSWYNHYQNINEKIILNALENASDEFELFQIDDGYEEHVGDWLKVDKKKFPNGLKSIVEKIHEKGMKAGIWIAPFVAENKSELFRKHPDWFCKDEKGKFILSTCNWSGSRPLDFENPEVISYLKECLKYYKDLGFDFFKLDFLYAISLPDHKGYSRSMMAQKAYDFLRQELGDRLILGCGAILSNCYGVFDYLRIGPDVTLAFDDVWYTRKLHRERLSTKITVLNTIYRHIYNGKVFLNDPDVFLLRDDNMKMNKNQKEALTMINALFGSLLLTSDNPKTYDKQKSEYLQNILNLFRNAKNVKVESVENSVIQISYELDGKHFEILYDAEEGKIIKGK